MFQRAVARGPVRLQALAWPRGAPLQQLCRGQTDQHQLSLGGTLIISVERAKLPVRNLRYSVCPKG